MNYVKHQPDHVCKNWFQCDSCGEKIEERSHDEIYGECFCCGGTMKAITHYRPKE